LGYNKNIDNGVRSVNMKSINYEDMIMKRAMDVFAEEA